MEGAQKMSRKRTSEIWRTGPQKVQTKCCRHQYPLKYKNEIGEWK